MKKINIKELLQLNQEAEKLKENAEWEWKRMMGEKDESIREVRRNRNYAPARKAAEDAVTAFRTACNERLSDELKAAEGRATARTIYAWDIVSEASHILSTINIPRKHMEGCKAIVDINAQGFPKAYKYTPESTIFCLEFGKAGAVYVTDIRRDTCTSRMYRITYTEDAKKAIIDSAEKLYRP